MRVLHLDLRAVIREAVELRCFWDNPNQYEERSLLLSDIADLTRQSEEGYYVSPRVREDLTVTGQRLFNWLNGLENWLVSKLGEAAGENVVLAIATSHQLAHLPWEVLHDGAQYLVQRFPAVVPVRWMSSDAVTSLDVSSTPQNRALRVMFMATSPRGVTPVLDYEQEEAQILKATARTSIGLTVEESGCLDELGYLIDSQGRGYFDVVHLTGHATIEDGEPRFMTETLTGDVNMASPRDIATALKLPFPPLVFLSGCKTGQAGNGGAVPSMAEQLLQLGAKAVLGWGQNVLDVDAIAAAAALYESLSRSQSLVEAVAEAYQKLIQQEARDWHLLRLYVSKTLPDRLVLPERTRGWQRAPRPSMATEFLDPVTRQVKVPTRESFVGRRRQLQNCLRALTQSPDTLGVLIHGMGGLGKSSLAARLCDRLPQFKRLVWQGQLDPQNFVHKLAEALNDPSLRQRLLGNTEDLKFRLRSVFTGLREQENVSFLLVFDDFEENLTEQGTTYRVTPPAQEVLQGLIWAIREADVGHRFILTSRYDFEMGNTEVLYKQPLDAFQGADLEKKCSRLSALKPPDVSRGLGDQEIAGILQVLELQIQARQLADGNPRLLEMLNDLVLAKETANREAEIQALTDDPTPLRKQIAEDRVLQQMEDGLREFLANGLVFELPVPKEAFEAVCALSINTPKVRPEDKAEKLIDQAIALGLLEVSPDDAVRVPRILPLVLPEAKDYLYPKAAEILHHLWWEADHSTSEEQALEIVRLGLLGNKQEIVVGVGDQVASHWINSSNFQEAQELCQQILEQFEDYRIFFTLARVEELSRSTKSALAYYRKSLSLCPSEHETLRAAILNRLARVTATQGETDYALDLWQDSLQIYEYIGEAEGVAIVLSHIAWIAAKQGYTNYALNLWKKLLRIHEHTNNLQGKADALSHLAAELAQQGDAVLALDYGREALEIYERTGNLQGTAAVLDRIAGVLTQQGNIDLALDYWQTSQEIYECTGNLSDKSRMLANMAHAVGQNGDRSRQLELNVESAQAVASAGAYGDLFTVLTNLSITAEANSQVYLAQAIWLGLRIAPPLIELLNLLRYLLDRLPQGDEIEALLAGTALFYCQTFGERHPQVEDLEDISLYMLLIAAEGQGIEVERLENLMNWITQQGFHEPTVVISKLIQRLEEIVGDQWLFDHNLLESHEPTIAMSKLTQRLEEVVGNQWLFDRSLFES